MLTKEQEARRQRTLRQATERRLLQALRQHYA